MIAFTIATSVAFVQQHNLTRGSSAYFLRKERCELVHISNENNTAELINSSELAQTIPRQLYLESGQ